MTYKENMKWLLGSATTRAAEEKKNNTDTAKWMAERSVAEGKLIQKLSVTGAKLIAKGHKQWREGQQAQATEDEYMRSVGWDPNSEEAKVLKDTEDGAIIKDYIAVTQVKVNEVMTAMHHLHNNYTITIEEHNDTKEPS